MFSIVDLASFDFVTFQHVLHHMVSDTLSHSRALQEESLAAMLRLTKPGGFLIFEEQTNRVAPFARLVYLLSRAANAADLRWRFFDVGGVVVSYLTPGEIRAWVERERARGGLAVETEAFTPWEMSWRWSWRLETFTESTSPPQPCSSQARAWAVASSSTQAPISRMKPVSSARGMISRGVTMPSSSSVQRSSASYPQMRPVSRSTRGW